MQICSTTLIYHGSLLLLVPATIAIIAFSILTLFWMLKQQKKYVQPKFSVKHRAILTIIGTVLMIVTSIIQFGPPTTNQQKINDVLKHSKYGVIFFAVILVFGPIMEEYFSRFMIIGPKKFTKSKVGYALRIVISIIFFALWHLSSQLTIHNLTTPAILGQLLLSSIPYVLSGSVLAYLYVHTQDIKVSVSTHIISDLILLSLLLLQ